MKLIIRDVAEYNAKALKIKVGALMFMTRDIDAVGPPGTHGDHCTAGPGNIWR